MSATSSIARSFTKRHRRAQISAPMPYRDGQIKFSSGTIRRNQISAPVELISSTNTIVYTAPDLPSASVSSANSSTSSLKSSLADSDIGQSNSGLNTPTTSPDVSPVLESPNGPEPNHLSSFFQSHKRSNTTATSNSRSSTSTSSSVASTPIIPQRSPSHTKKSHQELARQRSRSRMTPPSTSLTNTHAARLSEGHNSPSDPASHPFGKELEQVNEVAEEFGGLQLVWEEDEKVLQTKGLMKLTAEDYVSEIESLLKGLLGGEWRPAGGGWI